MQFPVFIQLHRSRQLFLFLFGAQLLAAVSVLLSHLSQVAVVALLLAIVVSAVLCLQPSRLCGLRLLDAKGGVEAILADGTRFSARVIPDTTVFRYLMLLRLKPLEKPGVFNLVLFPDALSAKDRRTLHTWLRWGISSAKTGDATG